MKKILVQDASSTQPKDKILLISKVLADSIGNTKGAQDFCFENDGMAILASYVNHHAYSVAQKTCSKYCQDDSEKLNAMFDIYNLLDTQIHFIDSNATSEVFSNSHFIRSFKEGLYLICSQSLLTLDQLLERVKAIVGPEGIQLVMEI